jgi:hypothetical protein
MRDCVIGLRDCAMLRDNPPKHQALLVVHELQ